MPSQRQSIPPRNSNSQSFTIFKLSTVSNCWISYHLVNARGISHDFLLRKLLRRSLLEGSVAIVGNVLWFYIIFYLWVDVVKYGLKLYKEHKKLLPNIKGAPKYIQQPKHTTLTSWVYFLLPWRPWSRISIYKGDLNEQKGNETVGDSINDKISKSLIMADDTNVQNDDQNLSGTAYTLHRHTTTEDLFMGPWNVCMGNPIWM